MTYVPGANNITNVGGLNYGSVNATPGLVLPESTVNSTSAAFYKTLCSHNYTGAGSNHYFGFFDPDSGSSSLYQVPSGQKFYVVQISFIVRAATALAGFQLGTATATFTNGQNTAPTGTVLFGTQGTSIAGNNVLFSLDNMSQNLNAGSFNFPMAIGQNLFPLFQDSGAAAAVSVFLIGKEA